MLRRNTRIDPSSDRIGISNGSYIQLPRVQVIKKRAAFSILPTSKEKHLCVWPAATRHMLELFFALWQNAKG
jgi:hypothetical protein